MNISINHQLAQIQQQIMWLQDTVEDFQDNPGAMEELNFEMDKLLLKSLELEKLRDDAMDAIEALKEALDG